MYLVFRIQHFIFVIFRSFVLSEFVNDILGRYSWGCTKRKNKLASLKATLVRNSAHPLTYSLTGVKCRATSVAKNWGVLRD